MHINPDKLRDVHAPAHIINGEIHWQMAAGRDAIDVSITANAVHVLGADPAPEYLDAFEEQRELLCKLAALKFSISRRGRAVRLDCDDVRSPFSLGTH